MLGTLSDGILTYNETHRFLNDPVQLPDGFHWDVLRLWTEINLG